MRSVRKSGISLLPESGVQILDGKTIANSLPVWLRLQSDEPVKSKNWVRLQYWRSFFDDNVRPLIRFTNSANKSLIQVMNGTLFGVGEWIGYIPEDTSAISISPVLRTGAFDFRIEGLDYISPVKLLLKGALSNPSWVAWAIETSLIGAQEEAHRALKLASTSTSFAGYNRWCRHLSRFVDIDGIDRPRANWHKTPSFRLFISINNNASQALQATVRSLLSQIYPRWSLHYLMGDNVPPDQQRRSYPELFDDARISEITNVTDLEAIAADYSENDVCALISSGDMLPDYALAAVAELLAQYPTSAVVYGDEDSISSSGDMHSPILRPDWSPYFHTGRPYLTQLTFLRARNLSRAGCVKAAQLLSTHNDMVESVLADSAKEAVHHIRRVLYRRSREMAKKSDCNKATETARSLLTASSLTQYPEATVILLSRDNADCLAECIEGLTKNTDYPRLHITLVDNGSVKPNSLALLRDLKRHAQINILERPGPFNFSALCNEAARTSQAPMLIFLNDDIAMRDSGWLKPLVHWAMRPDVGIAGAKLLFPNGRIQHAGVVLGLGGIAAHIYSGQDPRQAGYLARLKVAHEVSAVTAACVAIERKKFDAVGGFDADNLPVELNDIDLCLRLAERGFTTVWTPESVLIHHESATRGKTPWSSQVYRAQRAYFVKRWQAAIRDDPFFHPNLSLFSYKPALA